MATQLQRQHIYGLQTFLLLHKSQMGYFESRPMKTAGLYEQDLWELFRKGEAIRPDCSETVTMICRMAGLKSPSGPDFPYTSADGNSTSMWKYLPHYSDPSGAHVGAIVAFGVSGDQHVAMVREPGNDPILFSHGGTNGPIEIALSQLKQALGNPPTVMLNPFAL